MSGQAHSPEERRAALNREMQVVLTELARCSHVSAAGQSGGRSSDETPGGTKPPGDIGHTEFARRYGPPFHEATPKHPGARDDTGRERVLLDAKEELRLIRGHDGAAARRRASGESAEERNKRIIKTGEGWTVREVAIHFRCGEQEIRRIRKAAGRDPDLGGELEPENGLTREERQQRVRELRAQHLPLSAIAKKLGIGKGTVVRDLRDVA